MSDGLAHGTDDLQTMASLFEAAIKDPSLFDAIKLQFLSAPVGHPDYADHQMRIAQLHWDRYRLNDDLKDLNAAIDHLNIVVTTMPVGNPSFGVSVDALSKFYFIRYQRLGDLGDKNASITLNQRLAPKEPIDLKQLFMSLAKNPKLFAAYETELSSFAVDHPKYPAHQVHLGMMYGEKYDVTNNPPDMVTSIAHLETALSAMSHTNEYRGICLEGLTRSYSKLYDKLGELAQLKSALVHAETLVNLTAVGNSSLARYLHTLAELHWKLYNRLNLLPELKIAYRLITAVVNSASLDDPGLLNFYETMTLICNEYHYRWKDLDVLGEIIKYEGLIVQRTPLGHPNLAVYIGRLGMSFGARYNILRHLQDLEAGFKCVKAAIEMTPPGPNLAQFRQALGVSYSEYYKLRGSLEDLDSSIRWKLSAISLLPEGHSFLPHYQLNLATSYSDRYKKLNNLEDLDVTIQYYKLSAENYETSMVTEPEEHRRVSRGYQLLAKNLTTRFTRSRRVDDLDAALKYHRSAVHIAPLGHPSLASCLISLSGSHRRRYDRFGELNDLEIAHKFNMAALETGNLNLKYDPDSISSHIAATHTELYHRLGNVDDLITALRYLKLAVENTAEKDPSLLLQNLALGYTAYYRRFGNINDLYKAIEYSKKAADSVPLGEEDYAFHQSCLGVQYSDLYAKTQNLRDLEMALTCKRAAVDATPIEHYKYAAHQQHLAAGYIERYWKLGDPADLVSAHECRKEAVKYHEQDPRLAGHQESLAMSYIEHFRKFKDPSDLDAALKYGMLAYHGTPDGHFNTPRHQHSLATTFLERFLNFRDPSELYCSLYYSRLSTQSTSTAPNVLWKSATYWAKNAFNFNQPECVEAYKFALQVLPQLVWLGSSLTTRHDVLTELHISQTVSSAVAAAIWFHQPELGVEFIEQGLSITHKQTLQLKDEVVSLTERYPLDAAALKEISHQLGHTTTTTLPSPNDNHDSVPTFSVDHHSLAARRTRLIQKIRTYPGFENFFLPASYESLSSVASEGPVVLLNCSTLGWGDALILLPSLGIKHVSLPDANIKNVELYISKLRMALNSCRIPGRDVDRFGQPRPVGRVNSQALFGTVLRWLWLSVVKPVFDALNENNVHGGRLWWCPVGQFTYLPIHAASPAQSPFIQSYTFTLDALNQARERANQQASNIEETVVAAIGVSEIPDKPHLSLPAVKEEINLVMSAFKSRGPGPQRVMDSGATIAHVLEQIEQSSWLHIACHGQQNINDPLKSGILLADGTLELQQILDAKLPSAQFVFLSACETAMGDSKLVNEAMHLTGGFVAAGFQGAIGTLWRIADSDGPKVATVVYQKALEGKGVPDTRLVAEGLHLAIQKLREEGAPFQQWMPFIHVGI